MVSKNNHVQRMTQVAERQSHYGIRKMTVGAVSVLLGTSLWFGVNTNTVKADTDSGNGDADKAQSDANATVETKNVDKVVVDASASSDSQKSDAANNATDKSTASSTTTSQNNDESRDTTTNDDVVDAAQNAQTQVEKATENTRNKKAEVTDSQAEKKATTKKIESAAKDGQKTDENSDKSTLDKAAQAGAKSDENSDKKTAESDLQNKLDEANEKATKSTDKDADKTTTTLNTADLTEANQVLKDQLGASLVSVDDILNGIGQIGQALNNSTAKKTNDEIDEAEKNFKTVDNAMDLLSAANSWSGDVQGVNIKGNINLTSDLNLSKNFIIHGLDGATLTLNGDSSINNNANLVLDDVTVNGSVKGNGTVTIKGTVNSNVSDYTSKKLSANELTAQIGTNRPGATVNNWKSANINASTVNVLQGATLNINRSITGDGIAEGDHGQVNVGINAKLNIQLKDAKYASRSNESNSSLDNANAGIRILDNGTITTGDSAEVNIDAGHGRAIVVDEPFGGTSAIHNNILAAWENGRTGNRNSRAAKHRSTMTLGDSTKMNITGRGGILLGDTATFTTGEHSIIHIDNQGNGEGLLLDANSTVEVSPHSQLIMTSDGKDCTGSYDGGNYIGMGQNAKFRVEHDATFRYVLRNAGNGSHRPWSDNFNIISQVNDAHPEVYVGPNATFDGQSDYSQFNGEIFSFSLDNGSGNQDYFTIDGAKYVNWERTAVVPSSPGPVGGTAPQGNLYYSMAPSVISASGQTYYIFKWANADLNGSNLTYDDTSTDTIKQSIDNFKNSSYEYWEGITGLATSYSKRANTAEGPGHNVSASDIVGVSTLGKKLGIPANKFSSSPSNDTGFDPKNSQRLVLVATIIPVQEDETEQIKDPFQVIIKENTDLNPGEIKVIQEGHDGLKRVTKTTYYNLNPATGEKTIDTSKGDNGVETKTTILNEKQDEIIEVGPQTATINYVHKKSDGTTEPVLGSDGKAIVGTVTASPVAVNSDNEVIFDSDGNATAATIDYTNYQTDLTNAEKQYPTVISNEWQTAVDNGTNKYDLGDNFNKAAIIAGTATLPTTGPTYTIVLGEPEKEKGSLTVTFHDVTDNVDIPGVGYNSGEQDVDTPINYNPQTDLTDLENKGYVLDQPSLPTIPTEIQEGPHSIVINVKHGTQPVDPDNPGNPGQPINPNDPDGPKYPDDTAKSDLTKTVTRTIKYVNTDGDTVADTVTQPLTFTESGVLDKVTGEWVTPLTWSGDQDFPEQKSPVVQGYHLINVDKDSTDNINVDPATASHTTNDYTVTVTYAPNGKVIPVDKTTGEPIKGADQPQFPTNDTDPAKVDDSSKPTVPGYHPETGKPGDPVAPNSDPSKDVDVPYVKDAVPITGSVTYIDDTTQKTLKTENLSGDVGDPITYTTQPSITDYENEGYDLVSNDFKDGDETFQDTVSANTFQVHLKHGYETIDKNDPHGQTVTATVKRDVNYTVDGQASSQLPSKTESADFSATGYWDKVSKKVVDVVDGSVVAEDGQVKDGSLTWTPESATLDGYDAPTLDGYHVDKVSATQNNQDVTSANVDSDGTVKNVNVDHNSGNITVNIDLTKNGTHIINQKTVNASQTVHYVVEGGDATAPADKDQTFTFTYSGDTVDDVTNEVISKGTWNATSHDFTSETTPVLTGYYADMAQAGGFDATPDMSEDQLNRTFTVTYKPLGHIIPVDKTTGDPIPDADQPQFPNNPDDPTKSNPGTIPTVPDYTPVDGNPGDPVQPGTNPGDDVKVPYTKNPTTPETVTGSVVYIDDTTNKTLQTHDLSGEVGQPITYTTQPTITDYENQGYDLVSNDFKDGDETFKATGNDFQVHLKHGTEPVNPDNPGKPGEPINPNDPDGPKYPQDTAETDLTKEVTRTIDYVDNTGKQVADPVEQTVKFTESGVLDKVTGEWVTPLTWSGDQTVPEVTSPTIDGYHVTNVDRDKDGDNVASATITHNDTSYKVTVTYAPNGQDVVDKQTIPSTQTVKYVDQDGNELHASDKASFDFTYSGNTVDATTGEVISEGSWNAESHTYDTVSIPVIDGYVAISGYTTNDDGQVVAGGLTATRQDPDVEATVVYAKVGKIVPVDKDTNDPIPDAPTPSYNNDPKDPTKVEPNEPLPNVPNYRPEDPTPITPQDPTKDTNVPYVKDSTPQEQKAIVQYIDEDEDDKILEESPTLTGEPGEKIDYSTTSTIKKYTDEGYVLVNNGFPADAAFDNIDGNEQVFKVIFKHGTTPVNPDDPGKPGEPINPNDPDGPKYPQDTGENDITKDVTRTIKYVDADGKQMSPDVTQNAKFTASGVLDNVTGEWVTPLTWSGDQTLNEVTSPTIDGYHVSNVSRDKDGDNVASVTLNHDDNSYDVVVTYAKNGTDVTNTQNIPSSQVVKFVDEDGNEIYDQNKQTFDFTYSGDTVDQTTGQVISQGTWNAQSHTYNVVNVPVIDGYVATSGYTKDADGKIVAGGLTATHEDPDVVATVVYKKIGNIVPVDPDGKPIPDPSNPSDNVPDKPYVNDPQDPTKVEPNEPVPDVPGYTPSTPNVTPDDPTKDTPVVYTPDTVEKGQVIVNVHDDTTNTYLDGYGYNSGEEKVGSKVDFDKATTITDLENKGYKVVNPDIEIPSEVTEGSHTYTINVVHQVVPVDPSNPGKPGEPINPNDPDGPKWPADSDKVTAEVTRTVTYEGADKNPDPVSTTLKFEAKGYVDKVTGDWVNQDGTPLANGEDGLTWTSEDGTSFPSVHTPFITGYHIKSVSSHGTSTGDVEEITGINHDSKNINIVVTYAKNGEIVPVDPDGTPIPDAPTPQYPTDPTNPTTVTPDEGVPTVPGYHLVPNQTTPGFDPKTNTVTPVDPSENTPVKYEKDTPEDTTQHAQVIFRDVNNAADPVQLASSGDLTGEAGSVIDYNAQPEIDTLEKEGYVLTNDGYPSGAVYDNDKNTVQTFYIDFIHGTSPVNPDNPNSKVDPSEYTKDVSETVHYVGAGDETPKDNVQTSKWTRTLTIDDVTGELVPNGKYDTDWAIPSGEKTVYDQVNTPVVQGYHADKADIPATAVTQENIVQTVTYAKNGQIIPVDPDGNKIPGADTPTYPTDPDDPTKVEPDEPVPSVPGYTPSTPTVTPTDPGKDTPVVYTKPVTDKGDVNVYVHDNTTGENLPQYGYTTGEQDVGYKVVYDKDATINELTNAGYKVLNPQVTIPAEVTKGTQNVTIYVEHTTTTVTPDKPGHPGEPVNPSNPNGPKYPDGTGINNLEETGTQTIHYVGAGSDTPKDNVESTTFTKNITFDNVTGKIIDDGTWTPTSHKFGEVDTPVVQGYHADKAVAGGLTATPDNLNVEETVTYTENGKIVPVDPDGNKIPGADTPTYPTDPDNPTKVEPNEPVPSVPGYTPSTPSVTPQDPGKDTPVVYNPIPADKGQLIVNVHDNTTNQNLPQYGYDSGEESVGDKVTYDKTAVITELENKGYKVLNPEVTIPTEITKGSQTVTIYVEHGTEPVNPDNPGKPGEPINPNDPNGPKWPTDSGDVTKDVTRTITFVNGEGQEVHTPIEQTVHFTAQGEIDKVTGKWVTPLVWSPAQDVSSEAVPVVKDYHVVSISKDGAGLTSVKSVTLTHDSDSYKVVVTYDPNGKIVPVNPDGTPIPNADTPTYPTDPTNPSEVEPNEPVPTVPGYTPSTPTVTPQDPGKDTTVVYTKPVADKGDVNVYVHDNTTGENLTQYGYTTGEQDVGYKVAYDKDAVINELTNKGYDVLNPSVTIPAEVTKGTQNVTIYVKHGTTTVTPDKPGHPGEPIDPSNPNGPKYPDGTGIDNLEKTGTQTIHYEGAGSDTPKNNVQTTTFTKDITFDNVTGKIIVNGDWTPSSHKFGEVDTPVVQGYHADKKVAGGLTVTPENPTAEATVTYTKNGEIVPVTPDGTKIPNADTPTYKTDPNDPTKVVPDEPVPSVPGYTPSTPSVTPQDPGKDTPVVYNPIPADKGQLIINVHDNTTNENIPQYGYDSGEQDVGDKVDYDKSKVITELENKGYKVINPDVTIPTEITKGSQTVTIYVEHGTKPVNPDNPGKPGEPINPNDPNGPKWPTDSGDVTKDVTRTITFVNGEGEEVHAPIDQTVHFTAHGEIDKVTGKWVTPLTWSPAQEVSSENVPFVKNYHVTSISKDGDGLTSVKSVTLTHDSDSYKVVVTYEPNGKIIPVDPDGNPIKGADTPTYPTSPTNPSEVEPNEPVPSVPGYTPSKNTVTPENPGKDTTVVYTPILADKGQLIINVHDNTTNENIPQYGYDSGEQDVGDKVDYDKSKVITELENKGYKVINPDVTIPTEITKGDKTVTIYVEHTTTTVTPENPGKPGEPINPDNPQGPKYPDGTGLNDLKKTGTQTIHYEGAGSDTPKNNVQTTTFTKDITFDNVTGKIIDDGTWTPSSHKFGEVNTPVVQGYHADKAAAGGLTVTPDNPTAEATVTYTKNGEIIPVDSNGNPIPNVDTPTYKTDPNDPTKVVPDEPVPSVPGMTPSQTTVTPKNPGEDTKVVYTTPSTPVTPTTPTTPSTPSTPVTPTTPSTPSTPTTPSEPAPEPHPQTTTNEEPAPMPHPQTIETPKKKAKTPTTKVTTNKPKATKVTKTVKPHAQTVTTKATAAQVFKNTKTVKKQTLPQTGENNNEETSAAILGAAAASLGMIGLAGVKKRRKKN